MTTSNNLNITLVEQSQAQKEVTVNTAITVLDAILNMGVIDKDLATPPGSPAEGDSYIVAATATGDWATHEDDLAYYSNSAWAFITPNEGLTVWVNDEDTHYAYDGSGWVSRTDNLPMLGINTTSDATNRLSVNSDAVLFNHDGDDCQIKVNKNASGDTASYLFQTGFSGRAEFGLVGDDDFQLKVAPDGSSWVQSFVIDKTSGQATFKQEVSFESYIELEDGITAPSVGSGKARIYVDSSDGDLKIVFGDSTVKTIVTDS